MQLAPNQVLLLLLQVGAPLLVGVGAALLFQVWLPLIRPQGARLTCGFEERGRGCQGGGSSLARSERLREGWGVEEWSFLILGRGFGRFLVQEGGLRGLSVEERWLRRLWRQCLSLRLRGLWRPRRWGGLRASWGRGGHGTRQFCRKVMISKMQVEKKAFRR